MILAGAFCLALMTAGAGSRSGVAMARRVGVGMTRDRLAGGQGHRSSAAASAAFAGYRWTPDTVRLVACYSAFGIGYIIPATFVPVMAKQVIADPAVFGWAWPLFGAAAMASTLARRRARARPQRSTLVDGERLRHGARRGEPARHRRPRRRPRLRAARRQHVRGGDARRRAGRARGCGQRGARPARGDDGGICRESGRRPACGQLRGRAFWRLQRRADHSRRPPWWRPPRGCYCR